MTRTSKKKATLDWPRCVSAFTEKHIRKIADWRGLSVEFIRELKAAGKIGLFKGCVAFPGFENNGTVVTCHYRLSDTDDRKNAWAHYPTGSPSAPMIFGEPGKEPEVFESTWDALYRMDKSGKRSGIICARGKSNAKLVAALLTKEMRPYDWPQNDKANQEFEAELVRLAPCPIRRVAIPKDKKDLNDWGAGSLEQADAITKAEVIQVAAPKPEQDSVPADAEEEIPLEVAGDLAELRRLYGEPYYKDEDGNPSSINQSFWAGLLADENDIIWEPTERAFYIYTGKIFEEASTDEIKRRLSDRILKASRQTRVFWLQKQRTDRQLSYITGHVRGIVERRNAFQKREKLIHLDNGVFAFERDGGSLLPFSPYIVSRNCSPIAFDENARCDRFLNELVYPAMTEDDVLLVQKYFGLCLFGTNLIQRMLILDGLAKRGKTQLANAIQAVIGRLNCTQLRTEWLADRFETYRFLKKTLLIGVDVAPNFLSTKGASILKGLVGGDWFDAEQKHGTGSFQFQGNFCVIVTSNSRLRVRLCGDAGAWRRRLLIVRYEGPPPAKEIPDFGERLAREEGSGILNFALVGLALLLKDIDEIGNIALTEQQIAIVDNLLAESDSLRLFLQEAVEAGDGDLAVSEIVEEYAGFCPEQGWSPLSITEVYRSLEGLMLDLFHVTKSHCVKREGRSVRGFFGVRFK